MSGKRGELKAEGR